MQLARIGKGERRGIIRHHLHADLAEVEHPGILHQQSQIPHGMVLPEPCGAQDMDIRHVRMMLQHIPHRLRHVIVILFLHVDDDRRQFLPPLPRQRIHIPDHRLRHPLPAIPPHIFHRCPVTAHDRLGALQQINRIRLPGKLPIAQDYDVIHPRPVWSCRFRPWKYLGWWCRFPGRGNRGGRP